MKTLLTVLLLAALTSGAARAAAPEEPGSEGSDSGNEPGILCRIPPVSGNVFLKSGRTEFYPLAAISFRDAFYRKYVLGLEVAHHFHETFALSGRGSYAFTSESRAMQICDGADPSSAGVTCHAPSKAELDGRAPGQIQYMVGLDLQWSPIYGKISLTGELFGNFDLYLLAGAQAIGYKGPTDSGPGSTLKNTIGGEAGVGARIFLNRWFALRWELKDLVYSETVRLNDVNSSTLRQQFFFQLGFSLFFPTGFSS
jgi:outer membrane beta-barrel protein